MLIGGGLVAVLIGVVLLFTSGGDDGDAEAAEETATTEPASRTSEPETTSSTETTEPTTTETTTGTTEPPDVGAGVEEFFAAWTAAIRSGDETFLIAALHPLVPERYSAAACQTYLGGLALPAMATEVLAVDDATETWAWATDGLSTDVPDALGVQLRRTEDGATFVESEVHLARVGDDLRWFTDCGSPGGGA